MNSNRFNISIILFSVAIAITSSLFMWAIGQDNKIVTSISLGIIWLLEVVFLIRYINVTNKNLLLFLQSFQFNDSTIAFNKNKKLPFIPVYTEFNRIIELFNQLKIEKETLEDIASVFGITVYVRTHKEGKLMAINHG